MDYTIDPETLDKLIEKSVELSEHPRRKGTGILSLKDFATNLIMLYNLHLIEINVNPKGNHES